MAYLLNRAKMTTVTIGTGTVTLGTAVSPYQTWANAGAINTYFYTYLIEQGTDWEIGYGQYSSAGPTLTRILRMSSTGSLLNLAGSATVTCVESVADTTPTDYFSDSSQVNKTLLTGGMSLLSSTGSTNSITYKQDRAVFKIGTSASGNQGGMLYQAYPGVDFTLTVQVMMQAHVWNNNTQIWGLSVQDGTGKIFTESLSDFANGANGAGANEYRPSTLASNLNSAITYLANSWWQGWPYSGVPVWMRLQQSSGNFLWSISGDGLNWKLLDSRATSVVGSLSKIGFTYVNSATGQPDAYFSIFSWLVTTP